MTPEFQASVAELVLQGHAEERQLDALEQRRIDAVASQDGARVMWTLYCGWRLTKVLSLLPLTSALLGDGKLAEMLRRFWRGRQATTLYFVEECIGFLAFLQEALPEKPPRFDDVVAFESARLALREEQSRGLLPKPRVVLLSCEIGALIDALSTGGDVAALPTRWHHVRGELDDGAAERWVVVGDHAFLGP